MTVILITGPIASGKSRIGKALTDTLNEMNQAATFIDLDEEVLRIHGSFDWKDERDRTADWLRARLLAAISANKLIDNNHNVVVSGPFYLQDEIEGLTRHLGRRAQVSLFILEVPLPLRLERNRRRAIASPDEQIIDQDVAIEALPIVYGVAIPNTEDPQDTVELLLQKMQHGVGQLQL